MNHTSALPVRAKTGKQLKNEALSLHEAQSQALVTQSRRVLLKRLLDGAEDVDADVLRDRIELPEGVSPKVFGSVPGMLAKLGIIERIGFRKSIRPEAHSRPTSVWTLKDPEKARAWLAINPEPKELPTTPHTSRTQFATEAGQ